MINLIQCKIDKNHIALGMVLYKLPKPNQTILVARLYVSELIVWLANSSLTNCISLGVKES
jgi:hypothetical protein